MPLAVLFLAFVVGATCLVTPLRAESTDDSLGIYAVAFSKTPLLRPRYSGAAIYLGRGYVLTVTHLVGRWTLFTNLRVHIGGQELPATVVKKSRELDLTLLSVDETLLPVSLRLRRNPICTSPVKAGQDVVVVVRGKTARSRIMSPELIHPQDRAGYDSFITELPAGSGAGVFHADKKCLLGVLSKRVLKYKKPQEDDQAPEEPDELAGYFIPASKIGNFRKNWRKNGKRPRPFFREWRICWWQ